jgi:hypothetical protein
MWPKRAGGVPACWGLNGQSKKTLSQKLQKRKKNFAQRLESSALIPRVATKCPHFNRLRAVVQAGLVQLRERQGQAGA